MSNDYVESYIYNGAIKVLVNMPRKWVSKTYMENGEEVVTRGEFSDEATA